MLLICRYAILNETWRLVQDGILDVKDIDKVMSEGLGPRYAFMGPLETAHLNAEGKIIKINTVNVKLVILTLLFMLFF